MSSSAVAIKFDPDEYAAAVRAGEVQLTVTGSGKFGATLTRIDLPRLWMQRGSESTARIASVTVTADRMMLHFMARRDRSEIIDGRELAPGVIQLARLGQYFHYRTAGASEWAAMSLSPHVLGESAARQIGRDIRFDAGSFVRPMPAAFERLLKLHTRAAALAADAPELLAADATARTLEHALVQAMIAVLDGAGPEPDSSARRRHSVLIARFARVLEANPDQVLHMPDVCRAIGVSERGLRQICQDHLGMGPKRYLLLRRMHLARRALRHASPPAATVTETAMSFGFWELGRFAASYRQLFGEAPSTTLRRPADTPPPPIADIHRLPGFAEIT
jgi:AraC-like DNA-binding protein